MQRCLRCTAPTIPSRLFCSDRCELIWRERKQKEIAKQSHLLPPKTYWIKAKNRMSHGSARHIEAVRGARGMDDER